MVNERLRGSPLWRNGRWRLLVAAALATLLLLLPPWTHGAGAGVGFAHRAADMSLRVVAAYLVASLLLPRLVVEESLLAMRGLGLQLTTRRDDGSTSSQFIDAQSVKALVVNEGVQSCDVWYYLAVVVVGRPTMVLAYEASRPRLAVLSHIYKRVHSLMYE
jgi:hypothetical protein